MKHFLLILTLLCCLGTYGQSTKSVTFDFSRPSKLTPSYPDKAFQTDAGTSIKVSDVTFKSGDVSLSFTETGNCPGVWLSKEDNGYWLEPKVGSPDKVRGRANQKSTIHGRMPIKFVTFAS